MASASREGVLYMEAMDLPAERFRKIFGKHSADLAETFLLDIEEAAVQTASDLAVEMLVAEYCGGLPPSRTAAAVQRLFTNEDRLRLRRRPSHWTLTMSFLEHFFLPAFALSFMVVFMLTTAEVDFSTRRSASGPGFFDLLAILGFAGGAWLDHKSTVDGFRRVDTMERNPFFPRYGHEWFVQAYGTLFMAYIALTFSAPMLGIMALVKCLAAYVNGVYVGKRLELTREELVELMEEGTGPAPAAEPLPPPAAVPARRARPVRFDYGG